MVRYLFVVSAAALFGCVGKPAGSRTPDIRGEVVSVTDACVTVRLDADSELLPDGFVPWTFPATDSDGFTRVPDGVAYSMAIYSTEGYFGELKIEGGTGGQVFGKFIPSRKGTRSVRIGDRASCRTP